MIGGLFLRQVPPQLTAGISAGNYAVYGSVIRSLATGQIVAHLQETTGLARATAALMAAPLTFPLQAANLGLDAIGHSVSYVQNEQIKAAVAIVQGLQLANLAVSAVGIGVTVAGAAVLLRKIGLVEDKVDKLSGQLRDIARAVDLLRQDRIADDFTRLRTATEQMDEGWRLPDPSPQWRHVAREAHAIANSFERRAQEVSADKANDPLAAAAFVEAVALAAATRVAARLAAGDDVAARQAAAEGTETLVRLGLPIRLGEVTLRRVRDSNVAAGTAEWRAELDHISDELRPIISAARQREEAAAATSLTLTELAVQEIRGRDWLEAARAEEEQPLLCLMSGDAGHNKLL